METDKDLDHAVEAGARFAFKVRRAVQEPERWAKIIQSARQLMSVVSHTPIPPDMDDITLLALAYVASIKCAENLPPGDDVDRAIAGLKHIAERV